MKTLTVIVLFMGHSRERIQSLTQNGNQRIEDDTVNTVGKIQWRVFSQDWTNHTKSLAVFGHEYFGATNVFGYVTQSLIVVIVFGM
jgi:hypothetical protein